nr:YdiU family protein [Motiliproteus sp. SC1-56]
MTEGVFFARVHPKPLETPRLAHFNARLGDRFGLTETDFSGDAFVDVLAGRKPLPAPVEPLATAYSGHQFGGFNPGLGDGRAMLLGEFSDREGTPWEFQLKGSGPTPYSRGFDGRAVLRSVIREYLACEAVDALGIATTRALCVVASDTQVIREIPEPGAMMIRVARSHLRFGSFEHFYARRQTGHLQQLADYCINRFYPQFKASRTPYRDWFETVVRDTAQLIAQWQAMGFCHGVMNTDNFSILGLTFDYGPYGFLERYDPRHICNHSDTEGRYAFERQPRMALWNCYCLAQSLTPLIARDSLQAALDQFESTLQAGYLARMRRRLGLTREREDDGELLSALLNLLERQQLDYHRFLRGLCHFAGGEARHPWLYERGDREAIDHWLNRYAARLALEPNPGRAAAMGRENPKFVLRNYLAQEVIEAAQEGDYAPLDTLLKILQAPFEEHRLHDRWCEPAPDWASGLSVSCSS